MTPTRLSQEELEYISLWYTKTKALGTLDKETIGSLFDHIQALESEHKKEVEWLREEKGELLEAVKLAYRKHHLGDDSIGWDELSQSLMNPLCNVLGDEGFRKFLDEAGQP